MSSSAEKATSSFLREARRFAAGTLAAHLSREPTKSSVLPYLLDTSGQDLGLMHSQGKI